MTLSAFIKKVWEHPLAKEIQINGADAISIHRRMLEQKPLLRDNYIRWYRECLPAVEETKHLTGDMIEIGSGSGFLEKIIPGVIKTDVVANPYISKVMEATKLDYADGTLRCIFLVAVLHHVPLPALFLKEAERCLMPGGRLVMIEPNNNAFQKFLVKNLDHYEYFDDTIEEWVNGSTGRMSSANLALPWVIFIRDRDQFKKDFPLLQIKKINYHTFLSYIVTGGMTYKSFLPGFMAPIVAGIEWLAAPWMKALGTSMTIDIVKLSKANTHE